AVGPVAAFGVGPLLAGTAGLGGGCLLRTPLRWGGGVMLIGAILWGLNAARPHGLGSEGGPAVAGRGPGRGLPLLERDSDAFAVREWLAADGDTRLPGDATLAQGFACDPVGCIARLRDGALAAIVLDPEAFQEDCARAKIVLTARSAPPSCRATLVD